MAASADGADSPRVLDPGLSRADRVFHVSARTIGVAVLVLVAAIAAFLGYQARPTLQRYGWRFFTEHRWLPNRDIVGLASVLLGTFEVAAIALLIGLPLAGLTAVYICVYAPAKTRRWLVSLVDLMSAVPAIIYGLWALFVLEPRTIGLARWLSQHLGWIPILRADSDPDAANWAQSSFTASAFMAGIAVSLMVIPLACSLAISIFAEAPEAEREAVMALGGTRWGVVRFVLIPFGRRGLVGAAMLSLGRALGETIAVLLIIAPSFDLKIRVLTVGTMTTAALIADLFGEASRSQLSALLAAGFVLFAITIVVNSAAASLVRGRRPAGPT